MLYTEWTHHSITRTHQAVLPDGCRDVIAVTKETGRQVFLSEIDSRPRAIEVEAGTSFTGFRLRPGAVLDEAAMKGIPGDAHGIADFLASEVKADAEIMEVIDALAGTAVSAAQIARQAGVTLRTLQRQFHDALLPPPDFWRLLGRARRAATALSCQLPFAEIAYTCGYSGQAHMTCECVRWFGQAPSQLRRDPAMLADISQPGLGNWTGEQISIR